MEINRLIAMFLLALAVVLPEFSLYIVPAAAFLAIAPFIISEQRRRRFDKTTVRIAVHLAALSKIAEAEIAESVARFEGYEITGSIFKRTGQLKFPNYGRRSRKLARTLKLVLQTGNCDLLSRAAQSMVKTDAMESEINSLLSAEKYTLIISSVLMGLILGVVNSVVSSQFFLPYVVFQTALASIWLFFIWERPVESFVLLPPVVIAAFLLASRFA